jgi:hypothetical protein
LYPGIILTTSGHRTSRRFALSAATNHAAKVIKETAFTHLNRLVAFKMLEARDLIRGTLDKGADSNAFKFYLAEHPDDLELYEGGRVDAAYRNFLLWQSAQVAQEIRVLFDPDTLASRLFPRALHELLDLLNAPALSKVWLAEETVGWVYQYFNEPELQAAFEKVFSVICQGLVGWQKQICFNTSN